MLQATIFSCCFDSQTASFRIQRIYSTAVVSHAVPIFCNFLGKRMYSINHNIDAVMYNKIFDFSFIHSSTHNCIPGCLADTLFTIFRSGNFTDCAELLNDNKISDFTNTKVIPSSCSHLQDRNILYRQM